MTEYRPRRSVLFLPASNARAIDKACDLAADVVVLDLEDAVAPDAKERGRAAALAAQFEGKETVIRVNGLDSVWVGDDLDAVRGGATTILAPKVRTAGDVRAYRDRLGPDTPLWAMVETAEAFGRLQDIAEAGLQGLVLGANDLALELGARPGAARPWLATARTLVLAAARSRGLVALDGVCNDFSDDAKLRAECEEAAAMGYDGKSLIHPGQIETCNAAFAPTEAEIEWATRVRDTFAGDSQGARQIDGKMVEALHLVQAERLLAMANA